MRRPAKEFEKFFLFIERFEDGESKTFETKEVTRPVRLPKKIQDEYRARFGDEYKFMHFFPLGAVGTIAKGKLYATPMNVMLMPGRDLGPALFVRNPDEINGVTHAAIDGPAEYHCLVPRDFSFYSRKLHHNIAGLPDEIGFPKPISTLEIAGQPYEQFIYVVTGAATTQQGVGIPAQTLKRIPPNSGPRSISLSWPDTQILQMWVEPEE